MLDKDEPLENKELSDLVVEFTAVFETGSNVECASVFERVSSFWLFFCKMVNSIWNSLDDMLFLQ